MAFDLRYYWIIQRDDWNSLKENQTDWIPQDWKIKHFRGEEKMGIADLERNILINIQENLCNIPFFELWK